MAGANTDFQHEPQWRDPTNTEVRDARHTLITQSPWLTPYIGLRARLSQVWLNRWTVLLLLVLVRVLFAIADLEEKINDARGDAQVSCTALENVGSTLASGPHYMAQGINGLTATGVEKAIDGLMNMLTLTVTGVENIIIFAINVWTQTYLCLITLAISGALHAALAVIEDVAHFINSTIGAIGKDLHTLIDDFDGALNSAISGFDKIFHAHIPTLNVSADLDKLDHLQLPSGLDQGLQKLNNSIPNFAQVNNLTQTALSWPFDELKSLISNHTGKYTFNRSVFPIPQKERLSFCSDDNSVDDFFDALVDVEQTARKVAIAVLVVMAVAIIIPMTWWEIKRWRMMQDKAKYIDDHAFDSMDAVYVVSRPYSSMIGIEVSKRATADYKRRTLIRWCIAYCTSTPALFVLSLGIAGVLSGLCHYLCLKALTREIPALTNEVEQFTDKILNTVNNVSVIWANDRNGVILDMNQRVNHDVFGWVNTSTTALNHTLNTATDEMIKALNATFGGTILYDPIMDVYNCLIGLKVAGIEKGLTWVQDHAHIDFPLLPNDTFSLSHLAQKAGNDPDTDKAASFLDNSDSEGEAAIKGAVTKLVNKVEAHIIQETIISAVVLSIWVGVFLLGFGRTLWCLFTPHKTRGTGAGPFGFGRWGGHNHSLGPSTPKDGDGGNGGFATAQEKAIPPLPEGKHENPFDTPKLPDFGPGTLPPQTHSREPILPDLQDNGASNFRGQGYTLAPQPLPSFTKTSPPTESGKTHDAVPLSPGNGNLRAGNVSSGAVAPVMGHPRTSWRPELVGASRGAEDRGRMNSYAMFGGAD